MSVLNSAIDAMLAALQGIDGSGDYTNDLTDAASDRVRGEQPDSVGLVPAIFLTDVQVISAVEGVPLGQFERMLEVTLMGYAAGDGTKVGRVKAAAALFSDADLALMADRTLGGAVLDIYCTGSRSVDGLAYDDATPYGVFGAVYRIMWHADYGGGL